MKRRATRSAQAAASSFLRRNLAHERAPEASGLSLCVLCGRDFVVPVQWEPVGEDRWWMFLRCAECGVSREVTVDNAVAKRYDEELAVGAKLIGQAAHRLEHERMAVDAEVFVDALRHGFIEPADFAL
jgi:hypothetical protein